MWRFSQCLVVFCYLLFFFLGGGLKFAFAMIASWLPKFRNPCFFSSWKSGSVQKTSRIKSSLLGISKETQHHLCYQALSDIPTANTPICKLHTLRDSSTLFTWEETIIEVFSLSRMRRHQRDSCKCCDVLLSFKPPAGALGLSSKTQHCEFLGVKWCYQNYSEPIHFGLWGTQFFVGESDNMLANIQVWAHMILHRIRRIPAVTLPHKEINENWMVIHPKRHNIAYDSPASHIFTMRPWSSGS